jgi:hypothetical protein
MADNVQITAGSGTAVSTDEIDGVHIQRVKVGHGADGKYSDVSLAEPLPIQASRTDDLLVALSRIVRLLESSGVVDQQQRQRVSVDIFPATIPTVTTVTTVTTVATVSSLTNAAAIAGMDREQYINIARNAYANGIRAALTFA